MSLSFNKNRSCLLLVTYIYRVYKTKLLLIFRLVVTWRICVKLQALASTMLPTPMWTRTWRPCTPSGAEAMPLETPPKSLAPALTAQRRWSSVASSPQSTPWGSGTQSSPAHSLPRDRSTLLWWLACKLGKRPWIFFFMLNIFFMQDWYFVYVLFCMF